jgi:CheY-like chemotaxis protein
VKKILLADDSITIQKVVELTFSDADYQVICVSNGAQALKKVGEVRPNIVLLDVIMPEKNGYEVCEQIKRSPGTAGIPVLLLTGTFEPFDRKRAELAGADGHLTKPFESQVLVAKVEELIARTPTVVSDEDAGVMDIISGGDVSSRRAGAATRPPRSGGRRRPQPGAAMPPPAQLRRGRSCLRRPGARRPRSALSSPDPAAGRAHRLRRRGAQRAGRRDHPGSLRRSRWRLSFDHARATGPVDPAGGTDLARAVAGRHRVPRRQLHRRLRVRISADRG